jgi:hypothetical protein
VQVDIIKHAREMDGKSTAVHAAVLAPEDVRIFTYPCIPDYDPQENVCWKQNSISYAYYHNILHDGLSMMDKLFYN